MRQSNLRRIKSLNLEVHIADELLVKVGRPEIEFLKERVTRAERKRIRLCAHKDVADKLHEMFIGLSKETFIRPHKHLDKAESLHVIEGLADAVFFDDAGNITEVIELGDYASGRQFYYRVAEPTYHTLVLHSDFLIFHESTQGPFVRSQTMYAPWSPSEGDIDAIDIYRVRLGKAVDEFLAKSQ